MGVDFVTDNIVTIKYQNGYCLLEFMHMVIKLSLKWLLPANI